MLPPSVKPFFLLPAAALPLFSCCRDTPAPATLDHLGWKESRLLRGDGVEVVVVPQVGRIMQIRRAGETEGPLWSYEPLHGKAVDPANDEWPNFGGDKTWPAPQGDWPGRYPRSWPPPPVFDQTPLTLTDSRGELLMESPVDEASGVRFTRRIAPGPGKGQVSVTTTYYKECGAPLPVSVWVISQLRHPRLVAMPAEKFEALMDNPAGVEQRDGMVLWHRDAARAQKIGTSARSLVWVGEKEVLRIDLKVDAPAGATFPDKGCSAQIYTNPDPKSYVELETAGPLVTLAPGQTASATNVYTLTPRGSGDDISEARRALGL